VWLLVSVILVSQIYGWHLMSFQAQTSMAQNKKNLWSLTHVLGAECKCSAKVAEYLKKRGPQSGISEQVLIIGKASAEILSLKDQGFPVRVVEAAEIKEDLSRLGVPFLLIATPNGDNVYAGGYSEKSVQDGSPVRDLEILESLQGHRVPQSFPIFGCAISRKLQNLVDPFSLKYSNQQAEQ
jgi:hypothetical protein